MDFIGKYWSVFWREQEKKNKIGKPKYVITTYPETEEEEFIDVWIDKWHKTFKYFENTGCGCCYNSYEVDAPKIAIVELREKDLEIEGYEEMQRRYEEMSRPMQAGTPSSFSEFNKKVELSKHKDSI